MVEFHPAVLPKPVLPTVEAQPDVADSLQQLCSVADDNIGGEVRILLEGSREVQNLEDYHIVHDCYLLILVDIDSNEPADHTLCSILAAGCSFLDEYLLGVG